MLIHLQPVNKQKIIIRFKLDVSFKVFFWTDTSALQFHSPQSITANLNWNGWTFKGPKPQKRCSTVPGNYGNFNLPVNCFRMLMLEWVTIEENHLREGVHIPNMAQFDWTIHFRPTWHLCSYVNKIKRVLYLSFNNWQRSQWTSKVVIIHLGCSLQQARVKVEHITRVSFTTRRSSQQQGHLTIGNSLGGNKGI